MNNEIPQWWFALSAIFFVVNIILFIAVIAAVWKLVQFFEAIQPKVQEISTQVNTLIVKVDRVADRVEEVAVSVRDTVEGVGGRAKGVASSVEIIAHSASRQFEKISPLVVGAMTAFRIIKGIRDLRSHRHQPPAPAPAEERHGGGLLRLFGKH